MIAVNTNILVNAHRADSPWHEAAFALVAELAEGNSPWAVPWPCLHEFLAIVTHPRIYAPPSPLDSAIDQVDAWLESPELVLLSEFEHYWTALKPTLQSGLVSGPLVHDARIAVLCRTQGVKELWSADRDFGRFPGLKVKNPLVGKGPSNA